LARKSIAFSLLAAYHTYVFFAAALSILTLDQADSKLMPQTTHFLLSPKIELFFSWGCQEWCFLSLLLWLLLRTLSGNLILAWFISAMAAGFCI